MKTIIAALSLAVIVGISASVNAALVNRGVGLIYDTVLDITWLQDAKLLDTTAMVGCVGMMQFHGLIS